MNENAIEEKIETGVDRRARAPRQITTLGQSSEKRDKRRCSRIGFVFALQFVQLVLRRESK